MMQGIATSPASPVVSSGSKVSTVSATGSVLELHTNTTAFCITTSIPIPR
eukprot:CAMPEP_0173450782 /NCGR_PEP_ID=MMETSP1357-20121228/45451_1 /TAXON_ID=77926 /ORGANISM="Hemiselmis rufescens, Strain PCC563" /LENGTH=49 /DNA_ID= /DNA_START= /DNA_END= /DNA_ORIENTATION=